MNCVFLILRNKEDLFVANFFSPFFYFALLKKKNVIFGDFFGFLDFLTILDFFDLWGSLWIYNFFWGGWGVDFNWLFKVFKLFKLLNCCPDRALYLLCINYNFFGINLPFSLFFVGEDWGFVHFRRPCGCIYSVYI